MKIFKKFLVALIATIGIAAIPQTQASAGQVNPQGEKIENGKSYTVSCAYDQYQSYTMELKTSGVVNIVFNVDDCNWGTYMIVYDSSGQEVSSIKFSGGLQNYSFYLLAGKYTVGIAENPYGEVWGSFTATFTPSGETVSESYLNKNNQLGSESGYAIGKNVKAQFAANDDQDIYKVKISKTGTLTFKINSEIASMGMSLSSLDGNISYSCSEINLGTNTYKCFVPKGTYYITFNKHDNSGVYTFNTKLSEIPASKIKYVKNTKGKNLKIAWTKKYDVHGYQVQLATNKKCTKGKKSQIIESNSTTNTVFSNLKKNKTYYVRVRTYMADQNGKLHYSKWSATKQIKIKK